jgi:hypothetical protein
MVKFNVWSVHNEMPAVKFSNCQNVQKYASKIQEHMNYFNVCTEISTGSSMMPNCEHSYFLIQGILKDDDWRFFTQVMYDKIYNLADKPVQDVTQMIAHEMQFQKDSDLVAAVMLSNLQAKSKKRRSQQTWKSQKTQGSGSESNGSSSDNQKHGSRHTI